MEDVPSAQWPSYLTHFTRAHAHAPVSVEIHDPDRGPFYEVRDGMLTGITLERSVHGDDAISVMVACGDSEHLGHFVNRPMRVRLDRDVNGADRSLCFESGDGAYTIVRLGSTSKLVRPPHTDD